jgi:hypothetical protein
MARCQRPVAELSFLNPGQLTTNIDDAGDGDVDNGARMAGRHKCRSHSSEAEDKCRSPVCRNCPRTKVRLAQSL